MEVKVMFFYGGFHFPTVNSSAWISVSIPFKKQKDIGWKREGLNVEYCLFGSVFFVFTGGKRSSTVLKNITTTFLTTCDIVFDMRFYYCVTRFHPFLFLLSILVYTKFWENLPNCTFPVKNSIVSAFNTRATVRDGFFLASTYNGIKITEINWILHNTALQTRTLLTGLMGLLQTLFVVALESRLLVQQRYQIHSFFTQSGGSE